jgi:hypothetical protein
MAYMITRELLLNSILGHFERRYGDYTCVVDDEINLLNRTDGVDLFICLPNRGEGWEVNPSECICGAGRIERVDGFDHWRDFGEGPAEEESGGGVGASQ